LRRSITASLLAKPAATEGRIYHGNCDKPWDYVEECPYCDGTGGEIITTQADRNG